MITTQLTHKKERPNSYEHIEGISLTVPNQSLTIREILSRSGVLDVGQSVYYDVDPDHDSLLPTDSRDFDLSDISTISEEIVTRRTARKAEAEAQREEAEAKRKADELEAQAKAKEQSPSDSK